MNVNPTQSQSFGTNERVATALWSTLPLLLGALSLLQSTSLLASERVAITGGEYRSLFATENQANEKVSVFFLDKNPVTQQQFLKFVQQSPRWRRDQVSPLFADERYLQNWQLTDNGDYQPRPQELQAPVTQVSWFAAKAYCKANNGRLPTTAEWEYTAANGSTDPQADEKLILAWYSATTPSFMPSVGQKPGNSFGVEDMHGLIWEWTLDFSSAMTTGESRGDSAIDNQFFCGSAAAGSADPSQYAAFMRYALRSSLQGRYTVANLGFRCAYDKEHVRQ